MKTILDLADSYVETLNKAHAELIKAIDAYFDKKNAEPSGIPEKKIKRLIVKNITYQSPNFYNDTRPLHIYNAWLPKRGFHGETAPGEFPKDHKDDTIDTAGHEITTHIKMHIAILQELVEAGESPLMSDATYQAKVDDYKEIAAKIEDDEKAKEALKQLTKSFKRNLNLKRELLEKNIKTLHNAVDKLKQGDNTIACKTITTYLNYHPDWALVPLNFSADKLTQETLLSGMYEYKLYEHDTFKLFLQKNPKVAVQLFARSTLEQLNKLTPQILLGLLKSDSNSMIDIERTDAVRILDTLREMIDGSDGVSSTMASVLYLKAYQAYCTDIELDSSYRDDISTMLDVIAKELPSGTTPWGTQPDIVTNVQASVAAEFIANKHADFNAAAEYRQNAINHIDANDTGTDPRLKKISAELSKRNFWAPKPSLIFSESGAENVPQKRSTSKRKLAKGEGKTPEAKRSKRNNSRNI